MYIQNTVNLRLHWYKIIANIYFITHQENLNYSRKTFLLVKKRRSHGQKNNFGFAANISGN